MMDVTGKAGPILVPLDGSELAERALPVAVELARRAGAPVELVHVHLPISPDPIHVEGLPVIDEHMHSLRRNHERAYLEQARARLGPDVSASAVLLDGPVPATLAARARAAGAWLIALTTHGRGGLERIWLGSVADELARVSPVPLLLVRPEPTAAGARFGRILVPLDGSKGGESILEPAARLARVAGDAELILFEVVQPVEAAVWLPGRELSALVPADDLLRSQQEAARVYLEETVRPLVAAGLRARTRVEVAGSVAAAILEVATEESADLVALATHGRSGLARLALGSVADKVVRASRTPVLVFRPPAG
jgi:nucleotide-binding universal stress UspA family protein